MNTPLPANKNRLGRGLASLIGENVQTPGAPGQPGPAKTLPSHGEQRMIPIDRISPSPFNPRKTFDSAELDELSNSIREKGLVQPIVLRPIGSSGHHYEIVAGERRWRAAQRASLHVVPAIVRALTDQEALELAIIENVQRTDLNAIEEAGGYRELIDRFGYTQDELGQIIGKSRSHLANTLRLLKLPDSVQALVRGGELSAGHARALVGREDAEEMAREIVDKGLNVRDVEALVQTKKDSGGVKARAATPGLQKDADTRAAEREMADALGLAVEIAPGKGEAGEIIIRYRTLEQFETVRKKLAV
ncbi:MULTISPECIES: ParB/RepB/Spo0J family partition protein [Rhodomicrobium]|uniref:ParB/RepB/Spo0J family partition protein n=1 Tax=Rhodomicrobium TaxID=1068 RepID=UPI000B4B9F12|nr:MULTISPECIES: ParB/RepB/Spo0J family partition protein [Rhodomicrobium]